MCAYKRSSTLRSVVVSVLSLAISVGGLPAHALADAIESSQVEVDAPSENVPDESSVVDGLAEQPIAAQSVVAQGTYGSWNWRVTDDGALVIGQKEGNPATVTNLNMPWYDYREAITSLSFEPGTNGLLVYPGAESSYLAYAFTGLENLKTADLSNLNTSDCMSMRSLFMDCPALESVNLSGLDTSQVTDMSCMFCRCYALRSLDLSGLDTSRVTDMYCMFYGCSTLTELDVSSFNTAHVTDMCNMFRGCSQLEELDLSSFNTQAVTRFALMMAECPSLAVVDVSGWTAAEGVDCSDIFAGTNNLQTIVMDGSLDLARVFPNGTGDIEVVGEHPSAPTPTPERTDLSGASVRVDGWTYDATEHTVAPVVELDGRELARETDYTVSGDVVAREAGEYTVTITGTGGYEGTAQGTYRVERKAVTVTPNDACKTAGQADPTLTATVLGTCAGETVTYQLTREQGEQPGSYAVTAQGAAEQGSYAVSFGTGTLEILAASASDPQQGSVLQELRNDVELARQAYEEAVASHGGADVDSAKTTLEEAQRRYNEAVASRREAQNTLGSAQAELEEATAAQEQAASALDQATTHKAQADQEVETTSQELAAAQADQDAVDAASNQQAAIAAGQKRVSEAIKAKEKADQSLASADYRQDLMRAYTDAYDELVTAAQGSVADAQEAKENPSGSAWNLNKYNTSRGTLGFFEYMNKPTEIDNGAGVTYALNSDDPAIGELTGTPYTYTHRKGTYSRTIEVTPASTTELTRSPATGRTVLSYTQLGAEGDATSLESMRFSLEIASLCNAYRKKHNETYGMSQHGDTATDELEASLSYLEPVMLSDYLMAHAQTHVNFSSNVQGHAGNYGAQPLHSGSEILAWGYTNPFIGWYTQERAIYLAGVGNPNVDPRLYDASTYDAYAAQQWQAAVGHYRAVVGQQHDNDRLAGVAWNTHWGTSGMVFSSSANSRSLQYLGNYYTVTDYYRRYMSYYNAVKAAEAGHVNNVEQAAYDLAVSQLAQIEQTRQEYVTKLEQSVAAYEAAKIAQEQAEAALGQAQTALEQAQDGTMASNLDPTEVRERLRAAQSAHDAAVLQQTAAQMALGEATQAVDAAAGRATAAQGALAAAQDALRAAQGDEDAASAALDQAQAAYDQACGDAAAVQEQAHALAAARDALDDATDVSHAQVVHVGQRTYSGCEQYQPEAALLQTVTKGNRSETYVLSQGAGGELGVVATYGNNVHAGTGTVTLTAAGAKGSGTFWGSKSAEFTIARAKVDDVTVLPIASRTYDGAPHAARPQVSFAGSDLVAGKDYTLSGATSAVNAGSYEVVLTGLGDFEGTRTIPYTVAQKDVRVTPKPASKAFGEKDPALTAQVTGLVGTDTVSYRLMREKGESAGTYAITAVADTSQGNYAVTCTSGTFRIDSASLAQATIPAMAPQTYTGGALEPRPVVRVGNRTLNLGTDYTLSYRDNTNMGIATVTITGKGNYAGTRVATFNIVSPTQPVAPTQPAIPTGTTMGAAPTAPSQPASVTTPAPLPQPHVSYRTHVQRVGWQDYVADGAMSGTSGRSLRLEGINIRLSDLPCAGGIQYRTHVQRIGWQGWRRDDQMAGTSGRSFRLEAIEIKLYGELAQKYDVYYRVHCQRFGWMGWAKNGERSGSAGYSRRLEGIQIVLVPKGNPAPDATYLGITQRIAACFRQRGK